MVKVWLLSNAYGKLEDENKAIKRILEWRYKPETEAEFSKLGFARESIMPPLIASRADKYQLKSAEGVILPYSKMVAKGCAIRNNFYKLIKQYKIDDDDLIMYFDGDGQIDFRYVYKIVEALKENKFVLSNRTSIAGISDDRVLIERFENSFVEEKFGIELPDAQCGCWGLNGLHLKSIYGSLNAEGFEIELDLLINSLEKGVQPFFVDINVSLPKSTTFEANEDNLNKLVYLVKKFKIKEVNLIEKSQIFSQKFRPLPISYTRLLLLTPASASQ